ncbi:MAG TPA: HAMP domain-containing sensor histidine kinase [Vulgatibacter sp.]
MAESEPFDRLLGSRGEEHEIEDLLGIASHDLRSPLANIRSYSGMILAGRGAPLDPRVKRAAQVIAKNADRGLRQVDDLVDLLRSRSGLLTLEKSDRPMEELLRLAFEEARPAVLEREVALSWGAPDGIPTMRVDGDKMRRSVRALIEAAARRTPPGKEIRLTAEVRTPELYVAVEDSGPRPTLDQCASAFDWERQALDARRLRAGVALGLCMDVVKAHGGRVGMVPREPAGATWFLVIPR